MAQDETPELVEFRGERVYRTPAEHLFQITGKADCSNCPCLSFAKCEGTAGAAEPCGEGFYFVREDAWHKIKLRNS